MATRWGSRQKRKWATLSVDETPGSFRRLGEEEATRGDWPAATLPDSALNGKGIPSLEGQEQGPATLEEHEQILETERGHGKATATPDKHEKVTMAKEHGRQDTVTKQALSASLPRAKRSDKKPSVFKAFTWSKGKKSRSKLSESEGLENLTDPPFDPEVPNTQSGHHPPTHDYSERAVDVPDDDSSHKTKSSRTSSSASSTSSSNNKSPITNTLTAACPDRTEKQEGRSDLTDKSKKVTEELKTSRQGNSTYVDRNTSEKAHPVSTPGTATNQSQKTHHQEQSTEDEGSKSKDVSEVAAASSRNTAEEPTARESRPGEAAFDTGRRFRLEATVLVDDERPSERRVTYLGPVLLSPLDQRQGHYVHVTVASGFGNQASEGNSLMVRPARPVPLNGNSAPAAKGSSAEENGGQITVTQQTQNRGVNSQQNLQSPTHGSEAERTASPTVKQDGSSKLDKPKVDEDVMNMTHSVEVSSGITLSDELASLKSDGELSRDASLLDSEKETLHVVTEDIQTVFGPAPSPIPVDQSVVGNTSPSHCVSSELGSVLRPLDGGEECVSECPSTPQKRHQRSGSTSSSSSSSSSNDKPKQESYDLVGSREALTDKEVKHTLDHIEQHMEPSQVSTVIKEMPCQRATAVPQECKAASSAESLTHGPRRVGSFGRPHLELLDPHVMLSGDDRKHSKESRNKSPAAENRCDLKTFATPGVQIGETSVVSLPPSDAMNAEEVRLAVMEPVVISVTEHTDENDSLEVSTSSSSFTATSKLDDSEQKNDKRAEQSTSPVTSEGDSLGDNSNEEPVLRRSANRPQKPVRVSLVKEDTIIASIAPLNTEMDRPLLPLKGTPRQSSSSSSSSSSDSEDRSSKKKSTGDANESTNLQNVHSTVHENTPPVLTSGKKVQSREFQQCPNEKRDSSERERQGSQMNVGHTKKQSDSSSANSSQFFTDTSLVDQMDLPDSSKAEIHVTNEATVQQLHISPISSVSSRKEFSDSESSACSSVSGRKDGRKPPVFVTPPPPPEKPVRTCGSQSDLSERSDTEQDMMRIPPKPARSTDRLSPSTSPAFDRGKKKENLTTSTSSSSGETDQETKPPLVPPRREKPRVNGADHLCSSNRPQSGDHSAHGSSASSSDSNPSQLSTPENVKPVKSSKTELKVPQVKPPTVASQSLSKASDQSGASAFVPYEESEIYFPDKAFTMSHAPSSSGHKTKGKPSENKPSSSSDETKKDKEYSPPPVPPRQKLSRQKATGKTLNTSTSSATSLDSKGSHDLSSSDPMKLTVSHGSSADSILWKKNISQTQSVNPRHETGLHPDSGTDTQFIDRPRAGTCPQISVSHAVRDKIDRSFESELPEQSEVFTEDSPRQHIFQTDVKLPLKPIRSPSPRSGSRTPSPKVPSPQTSSPETVPRPSNSPFQPIRTPGKAKAESSHHTDEDTSETDVKTSMNRSISMSSTTSATSHEDDKAKKDSRSKVRKYWPFRRKKGNKKDKKRQGKDTDCEMSVSSPHLASLPLHHSTPTLERYASEPNTSAASASVKSELSDGSKVPDSDTSTLSESTSEPSKLKKAKDKPSDDKKAKDKHPEGKKAKDKHSDDKKAKDKHPEENKPKDKHPEEKKPKDKHSEDKKAKDKHSEDKKAKDKHPEENKPKDKHPEDKKPKDKHSEDIKAKDKHSEDKKAELSTSTSSSEPTKHPKTKDSSKKKKASEQKEDTSSAGNQSASSSKNVTPTPERKSKGGRKTERTGDNKNRPCDAADKEHDISSSSSSSARSNKDSTTAKGKENAEHKSFENIPLTPPRVATAFREHTPSFYPIPHHPPQVEVQHPRFDGEFQRLDEDLQADADMATAATEKRLPMVVVAMDLGTTHSGYAFSFSRDPSSVYVMSRWAGQEPGLLNHKTLSALLLTPDAKFHSFGLAARNHYHNLLPIEARHWLYFERFKMTLHHCKELSRDTMVTAINGTQFPALTVFAHVLEFLATHALQQLSDQSGTEFRRQDVRWVVTVPAIWREPAKQLMRQAALMAGMFTRADLSQLLIVLEPEAASIYCRRLRMHQLVPEMGVARPLQSPRRSMEVISNTPAVSNLTVDRSKSCESLDSVSEPTLESKIQGTRYVVVDCGGGTVDITVHELTSSGQLVELHRATGGPHGSTGVDAEFEALLRSIFSSDFIDSYQRQYPVGWVNLMTDFESRKRAASPVKTTSFNVSLPFTFISEYRKHKGEVDVALKRHGDPEVEWSLQGMLRLAPAAMRRLFAPTLVSIRQAIGDVLNHPNTRDLRYLFLVGGFAESPLLQHEVRREFGHLLTVLIPQDVSLAVLRGAVLFGLDPKVVSVRCARLTYGVGILNRFDPTKHPVQKRVHRDGMDWCTDIFDRFVAINEPVALGTSVERRYTPARSGQLLIVLNVYSSVHPAPTFITDPGVRKCGTLYLDLRPSTPTDEKSDVKGGDGEKEDKGGAPREILARMAFGDTEISVIALDVSSGKEVKASVDFLSA